MVAGFSSEDPRPSFLHSHTWAGQNDETSGSYLDRWFSASTELRPIIRTSLIWTVTPTVEFAGSTWAWHCLDYHSPELHCTPQCEFNSGIREEHILVNTQARGSVGHPGICEWHGALNPGTKPWHTNKPPFTSYTNLTPHGCTRRNFHAYVTPHVKPLLHVLSTLLWFRLTMRIT